MLKKTEFNIFVRDFFPGIPSLVVSFRSDSESIRTTGTTGTRLSPKPTFLRFSGFSLKPRIAGLGLREYN